MVSNVKRWKLLLFTCLGLAVGSAFCMKLMEPDLESNGTTFTVIGLELFYNSEKMTTILSGLNERVHAILSYHLYFDFAFMAGIFPVIAALCMIARERTPLQIVKKTLFILAFFQLVAWGLDIFENYTLLGWLKYPIISKQDLLYFHIAVTCKWIISLLGIVSAIPFLFFKTRAVVVT